MCSDVNAGKCTAVSSCGELCPPVSTALLLCKMGREDPGEPLSASQAGAALGLAGPARLSYDLTA